MVDGQVGKSFQRQPLVVHLDECEGKTLGALDVSGVFAKNADKPKRTGIAGDVVEQSVLFLEHDGKQEPDIIIDGVQWEVKTTGIRKSKKTEGLWEAKEPMSITAVSPDKITEQEYETSFFWHKVSKLLFFFYHYDSPTTVTAPEYARFPLMGYQFHEYAQFSEEERQTLEEDWRRVRNFIRYLQKSYHNYKDEYPRISHDLRKELLLIDTAPKWPNNPRFRFKRTFVSSIVQTYFRDKVERLEALPEPITNHRELDDKCWQLQQKYSGKTVGEICREFGIQLNKQNQELKSITEPIVVRMFGGKSTKMNQVAFFKKVGILAKSFVVTKTGKRTEDAKFFTIDFGEIANTEVEFEDSQFYEFFAATRVLVAFFEEPSTAAPLAENKFLRFKMLTFDDDFIYGKVRPVWERVRQLVNEGLLRDEPVLNKNGNQIRNKNGELRCAPNFPKSSEGVVFVRGTGKDSKDKREVVNGMAMYHQQVWLRGDYMANLLDDVP